MSDFFSKARNFLMNSKIDDTLDEIEKFLKAHSLELFTNDIISFRARYTRNKENETHRLESQDEISIEWNRLTLALGELLTKIEDEVKIEAKRGELQKSFRNIAANNEPETNSPQTIEDWSNTRNGVYNKSKRICLVHKLWPSKIEGQDYDIYIYLIGHKDRMLDDIEYAEFFLGKYWKNKVFKV